MTKEEKRALAQSYFDRIGSVHENAVRRPDIKKEGNGLVDRCLRAMINHANKNGDCIISGGSGYYRPVPGDFWDELELKEYIAQDESRVHDLIIKTHSMMMTFENWRKEAAGGGRKKDDVKKSDG